MMDTVALWLGRTLMVAGGVTLTVALVSYALYWVSNYSYRNWVTVARYAEFRRWLRKRPAAPVPATGMEMSDEQAR